MDKFTYFSVAIILAIQIYKLAKPVFADKPFAKAAIDRIDSGLGFIYAVVPGIYRIVEDMAEKGNIDKKSKWVNFLRLLGEQAEKEGVELGCREKERARLIVDTLAAEGHIKANPM